MDNRLIYCLLIIMCNCSALLSCGFSSSLTFEYIFYLVFGFLCHDQIHTVAVGAAIGQACLLLSAGTPGKRFMMPHAKGMVWTLWFLSFACSPLILHGCGTVLFQP